MKTKNSTTSVTTAIDEKNLSNVVIDLSKSNFDFQKDGIEGSKTSSKSLYIGMDGMTTDDKKKFRGKIRRDLNNYVKDILGKDRSESERKNSIISFMEFYKKNWKITDFKIENFSEKKNEADLRDYKKLLDFLKSVLES